MRVDDDQIWIGASMQLGQAGVVAVYLFPVEGDQVFLCCEHPRYPGVAVEGAAVVEGVAGVQNPPVAGVDRDARMPAGMSGQRDVDQAGGNGGEFCGRREPTPRLAEWIVLDERRPVRPLGGPIAQAFPPRRRGDGAGHFGGGDVDSGVWEVGEAADVIQVEVGDDDVAYVVTAKPESSNLIRGCLAAVQPGPGGVPDLPYPLCGVGAVLIAEAGVDQYDSVVLGFDEQHVAH